jgi:hypothetical protein
VLHDAAQQRIRFLVRSVRVQIRVFANFHVNFVTCVHAAVKTEVKRKKYIYIVNGNQLSTHRRLEL